MGDEARRLYNQVLGENAVLRSALLEIQSGVSALSGRVLSQLAMQDIAKITLKKVATQKELPPT